MNNQTSYSTMETEQPIKKLGTKIVVAAMFALLVLSFGAVGMHAVYADSCHGDCDGDGEDDGDTSCTTILGIPIVCSGS